VLGALLLWWGRVSTGLLGTVAAAPRFFLSLSPLSGGLVEELAVAGSAAKPPHETP
jgi:hypothetical protein